MVKDARDAELAIALERAIHDAASNAALSREHLELHDVADELRRCHLQQTFEALGRCSVGQRREIAGPPRSTTHLFSHRWGRASGRRARVVGPDLQLLRR